MSIVAATGSKAQVLEMMIAAHLLPIVVHIIARGLLPRSHLFFVHFAIQLLLTNNSQ